MSATQCCTMNCNFSHLIMDKSFADAKRIISQNVLLACPDFTKPFETHVDASDLQLASAIAQNSRPLACRKMAFLLCLIDLIGCIRCHVN